MMRRAYRIRGDDDDDRITNKDAVRLRDDAIREFRERAGIQSLRERF